MSGYKRKLIRKSKREFAWKRGIPNRYAVQMSLEEIGKRKKASYPCPYNHQECDEKYCYNCEIYKSENEN